jgi:hypothetical protein
MIGAFDGVVRKMMVGLCFCCGVGVATSLMFLLSTSFSSELASEAIRPERRRTGVNVLPAPGAVKSELDSMSEGLCD